MPDGRVEFEITADGRKAYASIDQVTDELRKAGVKWEKDAKTSTDHIGGSFESTIKKIVSTISAAAIGKMILNIGKDAIQAASDLQEVQNVVDVTFGEAGAAKIESWAKKAGNQFGLTETQAKRFSSTIGAMMKSSGLAGDEIVDMSTDLAGLAADMASFYNLDFDTAFQKIRSGISGETEPLKQLGINMSVANLNAYALQQGLGKTFDQMTQGEQVMLRYQYLMQATADASGDFARTSDGFANARRMLETNIESLKTKLGEVLLPVVNDVVNSLNTMFDKLTGNIGHTVLDDFRGIDTGAAKKTAEIEKTADQARALAGVLEELDAEGLGNATDKAAEGNEKWLKTCEDLVQTLPGLNGIINTETGEIEGGIDAVYDYITAWEEAEKKMIAIRALEEKEQALAQKRVEMVDYELQARADRIARENWEAENPNIAGNVHKYGSNWLKDHVPSSVGKEYLALLNAENESTKAFDEQSKALAEAEDNMKLYRQAVEEMPGDINLATDATEKLTAETSEVATEADKAFNEALDAVNAYRAAVKEATQQAVDSQISGFGKMKTAAQQAEESANAYQTLKKSLTEAGKAGDELQISLDQANKQITLNGMIEGLESQLAYIEEYQANLKAAREAGISDEILGMLSDGSNESAMYLNAIAEAYNAGNTEEITRLNDMWLDVNEGKKSFVDTLTQQKLEVDSVFDEMVTKAQEAAANLDVSEMVSESSGNNVQAIADAVAGKISAVAAAVDGVLAELNRLNEWGVTIDYGFGASTVIKPGAIGAGNGNVIQGKFATGLDWVPFDGFLASLHEGEGILTAEENRIWQAFKSGQRGVDYEQIGGMISGIKPGGNVYLNGRVVGQVVSDMQGDQYRTMKRSGWQQ